MSSPRKFNDPNKPASAWSTLASLFPSVSCADSLTSSSRSGRRSSFSATGWTLIRHQGAASSRGSRCCGPTGGGGGTFFLLQNVNLSSTFALPSSCSTGLGLRFTEANIMQNVSLPGGGNCLNATVMNQNRRRNLFCYKCPEANGKRVTVRRGDVMRGTGRASRAGKEDGDRRTIDQTTRFSGCCCGVSSGPDYKGPPAEGAPPPRVHRLQCPL